MREVLNTLWYLHRSGCQWDMLPHDLLPKSTVYDYFTQWRDDGTWDKAVTALREQTRVAAGREPTPSAAFADQKYHNHALDAWMAEYPAGWRIEVKARPAGARGFIPLKPHWVIERTNAWHGRYRRNSKDYERTAASSTAMIKISHIHLMLNSLSPADRPAFHYRKEAA